MKRRLLGNRGPNNPVVDDFKERALRHLEEVSAIGRAVRTIELANESLREKVVKEASPAHLREVIKELLNGDLGLSSMAIIGASVGVLERSNHPVDPDDLLRCFELLRKYPWMREPAFAALKNAKHTPWPQLIHHWDQLTGILIEEVTTSSHCIKTYTAMKNMGC